MSEPYRSEHEASRAHLESLLHENDELRRRVASLDGRGASRAGGPFRHVTLAFLAGALLGGVVTASAVARLRAPARCPYAARPAPSAPAESSPAGAAAAAPLEQILRDSRVVHNCWRDSRARSPVVPDERFGLRLDVTANGAGTIDVTGTRRADVSACIRAGVARLVFPAGAPGSIELRLAPAAEGDSLWTNIEPGNCPYSW